MPRMECDICVESGSNATSSRTLPFISIWIIPFPLTMDRITLWNGPFLSPSWKFSQPIARWSMRKQRMRICNSGIWQRSSWCIDRLGSVAWTPKRCSEMARKQRRNFEHVRRRLYITGHKVIWREFCYQYWRRWYRAFAWIPNADSEIRHCDALEKNGEPFWNRQLIRQWICFLHKSCLKVLTKRIGRNSMTLASTRTTWMNPIVSLWSTLDTYRQISHQMDKVKIAITCANPVNWSQAQAFSWGKEDARLWRMESLDCPNDKWNTWIRPLAI
jgi:hypothetical protein